MVQTRKHLSPKAHWDPCHPRMVHSEFVILRHRLGSRKTHSKNLFGYLLSWRSFCNSKYNSFSQISFGWWEAGQNKFLQATPHSAPLASVQLSCTSSEAPSSPLYKWGCFVQNTNLLTHD